ncbi:transglutaminase-like domain-containing protein [Paludibacter sp.]|uniref:transglutaminase-like domain-containing protein n=1 Tax=Paludibacter sp. TaxID=1898105 RepID=UPI001355EC8D|nr:transglutaminase-like domain-containing protein [Paludibacter sp.]MTK54100.1 transglutaminase domain-containing protein [Paludibacter sp.]
MRKLIFCTTLLFSVTLLQAQKTYHGLPVITAKDSIADYRLGDDWYESKWRISPQITTDTLIIQCFLPVEDFTFYTDKDSIQICLHPGQVYPFFVLLNDTSYAKTVIRAIKPHFTALSFDSVASPSVHLIYENNNQNSYLIQLHDKYRIDRLVKGAESDSERALKIIHWIHGLWKHDGYNAAEKKDALYILDKAEKGDNFRCVEFGIVTAACLNSIGLKARVLSLKVKDVETRLSGAGHVVAEVYLNDLKKWVLLDSQWDAMPILHGIPLNAVEFQKAITEHYSQLEISSLSGVSKRMYTSWIYPYLYYFNCPLDNREGVDIDKLTIDGKKALMLVPLGAKNPTIFLAKYKLDYCIYTHSLSDFYAPPSSH